MLRNSTIVCLLLLVVLGLSACQPIQAQARDPMHPVAESVVLDGTGPSTAKDPAQMKAEAEFLAVAIAKEQAYYAKDYEQLVSFYADNVISVPPGAPEVVGKVALAEGLKPFLAENDILGKFTLKQIWVSGDYATRYGEWDEVITPIDGGKPFHQIGRCFLGWQKINGEWKVVSEFINYIQPPTEIQ